jgi:RND superfamily putative drug exporter
VVRRVVRRPAVWAAVAGIGLLALAAPALGMRIGNPPNNGFPSSLPVAGTANQIATAFPGRPAPAQVVVTGRDLGRPEVARAVAALRARATGTGPLRLPVTASAVADGRGLVIDVPLAGNGDNSVTHEALSVLRDDALPATLGRVDGVQYSVTGSYRQYRRPVRAAGQDAVGTGGGRGAGVRAAAGRVPVRGVALISVGLNLLSAFAYFGLITWIFQGGHFEGCSGSPATARSCRGSRCSSSCSCSGSAWTTTCSS